MHDDLIRLPYFADAWFALVLVLFAFSLAHFLNHRQARARNIAALVAGVTMIALSGAIATIEVSDRWDYFTGTVLGYWHDWIPYILRAVGVISFLAGFLVIRLASASPSKEELILDSGNSALRYGRVSRLLHWWIAILIMMLIPQAMLGVAIAIGDPLRDAAYVVHKSLGFTVFILAWVRIFWHRYSPKPETSSDLKPWESKLSHLAHFLLYGFMLAFPISGYTITALAETGPHFFFIDLPYFYGPGEPGTVFWWARLHSVILPWTLYVVLAMHILGAMKHHFIDKHADAIKRMLG